VSTVIDDGKMRIEVGYGLEARPAPMPSGIAGTYRRPAPSAGWHASRRARTVRADAQPVSP